MKVVLSQAALVVTALGLVAAVLVAVRRHRVQPAVAVLSDFLLAAGLIRLAGQPTWGSLAVAAATAGVRVLLNVNLRNLSVRLDGDRR
ncbi:hypothetical protein SAZ11_50430 [Streptomyces sp. FXJ1.4098]|uniref:hypothetical protein n=1 Tax=Streptomyces sp. NPDC020845 TaxID=3365096 RepID=UPI00299B4B5B|nr:hypothetical protein [Streptomyces sp. FXJ1.4098]